MLLRTVQHDYQVIKLASFSNSASSVEFKKDENDTLKIECVNVIS